MGSENLMGFAIFPHQMNSPPRYGFPASFSRSLWRRNSSRWPSSHFPCDALSSFFRHEWAGGLITSPTFPPSTEKVPVPPQERQYTESLFRNSKYVPLHSGHEIPSGA